jgi:hypothetical protein
MSQLSASQYRYRVTCPSCGDHDGHLRVAYRDDVDDPGPFIVSFSCLNQSRPGHAHPADAELLSILAARRGTG